MCLRNIWRVQVPGANRLGSGVTEDEVRRIGVIQFLQDLVGKVSNDRFFLFQF